MKQITLSKKEKRSLNEEIKKNFNLEEFFSDNDFVALVEDTYILKDGDMQFFYNEDGKLTPALKLLLKKNFLQKVVINMGAVPFIAKGADLMRPGITAVDTDIEEGTIVSIVDENNLRPIAVGESLFSKLEMEDLETGKMILNIHHVGDDIWELNP